MKKFITPEINIKELFASDSVMAADIQIILSANKMNNVTYNTLDDTVDDSALDNYNMWKGRKY